MRVAKQMLQTYPDAKQRLVKTTSSVTQMSWCMHEVHIVYMNMLCFVLLVRIRFPLLWAYIKSFWTTVILVLDIIMAVAPGQHDQTVPPQGYGQPGYGQPPPPPEYGNSQPPPQQGYGQPQPPAYGQGQPVPPVSMPSTPPVSKKLIFACSSYLWPHMGFDLMNMCMFLYITPMNQV